MTRIPGNSTKRVGRSRTVRAHAFAALACVALSVLAACSRQEVPAGDSAFAALQARGADKQGMGVDQYTSKHKFDVTPTGGRIELQRDSNDTVDIAQIRQHLRDIAASFAKGDFKTPGFVHMQEVPGTDVMSARRSMISYSMHELPRGGEVLITTTDSSALAAIHSFIAFQRQEHHAGGSGSTAGEHMHGDSAGKH